MKRAAEAAATVDPAALAAYREVCRASAPVHLGVISNPFSRRNARTRQHDRVIPRHLPDHRDNINTRTAGDLDRALLELLFERRVNVLGLNGGDGTLHAGVNRLIALQRSIEARFGEPMPLPRLLFLNGGTLNIVSRATGTKGNPARTVRTFIRRTERMAVADLVTRRLPLLRVEEHSGRVRFGFIFGSTAVANALEIYTLFGEGYPGLARFLWEVAVGYAFNTRLWQEHSWKLDPPATPAAIDGVVYPRYLCAVAATIDLAILKGVIRAFRIPDDASGFFVKLLTETDKGRIIRLIPKLMVAGADATVIDVPEADELRLAGGYTLDGELFLDRAPWGDHREVVITRAPVAVDAVAL